MNKDAYIKGFEDELEKIGLNINDIENYLGIVLTNPKIISQAQRKIEEAKARSLALRHPVATGLLTLGIWPAIARTQSTENIGRELMRRFPSIIKAQNELEERKVKIQERLKDIINAREKERTKREAVAQGALALLGTTAQIADAIKNKK